MRIIVGRDYYDTAMAFGHDDSVVFVRSRDQFYKQKEIKSNIDRPIVRILIKSKKDQKKEAFRSRFNENEFMIHSDRSIRSDKTINYVIYPILAVICGKAYRGVKVVSDISIDCFWHLEALQEWLGSFDYYAENYNRKWYSKYAIVAVNLDDYFKPYDVSKDTLKWLIEHKFTILTFDGSVITSRLEDSFLPWQVNGDNLKDLQFFKVLNPFTIFQEIEMWISGVIPSFGNPMVEIKDNNIKIAKHGFDKFSFKKPKQNIQQ